MLYEILIKTSINLNSIFVLDIDNQNESDLRGYVIGLSDFMQTSSITETFQCLFLFLFFRQSVPMSRANADCRDLAWLLPHA